MTVTVLLVDDEPHVIAALAIALRNHDYDILTATSGPEGLDLLAANAIDVIVSDEQMGPMAGSEFLRRCREQFPDSERVVLTGHASIETTMAAINDAAVHAFLTKPCDPSHLAATIDSAAEARARRLHADAPARAEAQAHQHLDAALADIELWYQPIFDVDRIAVAHEALLRTRSVDLATPSAVVETATALGRHADVDRCVRDLAVRNLERDIPPGQVYLNMLPESLSDNQILGPDDPIHAHKGRIVVEITERAHLGSIDDIQPTVEALRRMGHRIAVDDLGAGYAGLTSVALLEPDIVKFDMELIRDIDTDKTRAHLVAGMVETCHGLGIAALAEGIETPAELDVLMAMGFDLFQGYLLGKPAPPPL